jgi:hypothetical protein
MRRYRMNNAMPKPHLSLSRLRECVY